MDLSAKKIMLTGGTGFLGSFVTEQLKARGCKDVFTPTEVIQISLQLKSIVAKGCLGMNL